MHFINLVSLIALLFVSGAVSANAASFDCAKKESIFEYAICSNDELSLLDEKMAVSFKVARSKVSKNASQEILAGQRRWHEYAQKVCIQDMTYPTADYGDDGIFCLQTTFRNRIDVLDKVGAKRGLIFYSQDQYRALYTDEPDEWSRVADHVVIVPQLDGGRDEVAFNGYMREVFGRASDASSSDELSDFDLTSSTQFEGDVQAGDVTAERISVEVNYYMYGHGAAHGNYAVNFAHFLRNEGRPLGLQDIFVGTEWVQIVRPLILSSLEEQLGEGALWEDLDDLENSILDPSNWALSTENFSVQFQPYEVSAYAAGAPVAYVNWEILKPYLSAGAPAIIGLE